MDEHLIERLNIFVDAIENGKKRIVVEEKENDDFLLAMSATHQLSNGYYEAYVKNRLDPLEKQTLLNTEDVHELTFGLYGAGEFVLALKLNTLNEVAVIKDSGYRNGMFNTDWKQTIYRKKLVTALDRFINEEDTSYLERTIKYLMKTDFFPYSLPSNKSFLKKEAKQAIELHTKLVSRYNLDNDLTLNTINPFDNF